MQAHFGRYLGLGALAILIASAGSWPARLSAADTPRVVISEVLSSGNDNGTYRADWFEVTNVGTTPVDITGWKMDDNSNAPGNAVALRGVTMLAPGKSAVFLEGTTDPAGDATLIAAFSSAWFGSATLPDGVLVGVYGGSGVGLTAGGDAVNLFDSTGTRVTGVSFGPASTATPVATFDNSARLGSATLPLPMVAAVSAAGVNGAFVSFNGAEVGSPGVRMTSSPLTGIDLSTYIRVGRFDLPEPTRTAAPPNNLLAQETSAVTYNWDTDTLFIVGDGGRAVVQVTKTGELIDTMTLALGGSPQGNEFYDPEGLAYIGGGRFVMTQERDRMAVLFTYLAGTTLQRADTQSVTLGTFVENIGLEGISYDPQTNAPTGPGFIAVKEISPEGLFQTNIDFAAGTATNGSPGTVNSVDLFDPALANLLDFADIFALSNLRPLRGQPQSGNLLVLSQEEAKIVNIDRAGHIASALTIVSDAGNPLSVADQQHEGMTMDENGVLYVVSENGGGDINHPQLWVYAPSSVPNQPPTDIALTNVVTTLAENTSTATRLRVAGITVTDDALGNNVLSVGGTDAAAFEADNSGLYIKAGTVLDFETQGSYSVVVQVDDPSIGATPDASVPYTLALTDVVDENPPVLTSVAITEVAPWASTAANAAYAADWIEITNISASPVDLTGWKMDDDSASHATAVALTGVTTLAPGQSAVFLETSTPATTIPAFLNAWFGANPPATLLIGSYSGSGVGLGGGGDQVNLFDATGRLVTGVRFAGSTPGFTFDNAAGVGGATSPPPVISTLSAAGVNGAFVAADGIETGSPGTIVTRDVTPPVIAPNDNVVADTTSAAGAIVTYTAPSTLDDVDGPGVATCAPASGSLFPVGVTTVTCTAQDAAGNQSSSAFTVTVTLLPPPATPDGRMFGIGHVDESGTHHHFAFRVSEIGTRDFGRFEYWLSERRSCDRDDDDYDGHRDRSGDHDRDYGRPHQKAKGRFEAASIASIVFSDDPALRPGRGWPFFARPRVDSVTFSGTGKWNGKPGYTFTVTATDQGEPGRRRDTFTLQIADSRGRIVASVNGELDRGNIQSTRLLGAFFR